MTMNIHQEARRRQMHMDRVCEARSRLALVQQGCTDTRSDYQQNFVKYGDQDQVCQIRGAHVWRGPMKNWRSYDHCREGPIRGQTWRALEREMKFLGNSLSASHSSAPSVRER